jgi:flagellin
MGTRIATNVDSLRGLRTLNKAQDLQSQTLQRLSTGTTLNAGKDNPSGLIASETLRSQITAIEQSLKNSSRANNVIGTADAALDEVSNLLDQIRGLVQEGVNRGALSQGEIQANQSQIDAALNAINKISSNTSFAGDKLLDGSKSFTTTITNADRAKLSDVQINEALFGSASSITVDATVVTAATKGSLTYNGGNLSSATTVEFTGSKGSQVLFFGASSSLTNIKDAVNAVTDVTGVSASISTAAIAGTLTRTAGGETATINGAGANDGIKFVAKRQEEVTGAGNVVNVTFVNSGGTVARSISVTGNAIVVTLATTGGTVNATETANAISTALNANASANALVQAYSGAGVEGDGTGVLAAAAATNLTGGTNNNLVFTDARQDAGASDTAISITYAVAGASTALSATVNGSNITFNLATDAAGVATTTAAQLTAAITGGAGTFAAAKQLVSAANASGNDGSGVLAATTAASTSGGVNGTITFSSSAFGKSEFVDINVLTSGASFQNSVYDGATLSLRKAGSDIVARVNGQTAVGKGLRATVANQLLNASITFTEGNNVALTNAKVTITGGGSLFQIGQDVSTGGQVGVGIEGINTARLGGLQGKLFELGSGGGKSLLDVGSGVTGDKLVSIITDARDRVNNLRSRLGSLQKNVIETNISSLGVALEKISDAKSSIADTDYASETATLTKAQILNQAGISALQIANSGPQSVLSLLRG